MSPSRTPAQPGTRRRSALATALTLTAVLLLWEVVVNLADLPARLLPAPSRILDSLAGDLPRLLPAAAITLTEALLGLALGTAVGALLAYLLFLQPFAERVVSPLLVLSQAVPLVAVAPLVIIWFGFEMSSKVLVAALFAGFPVCIALLRGLQRVPVGLIETARTMGAGPWWILARVRTPAAAPEFFSGLRIAATYTVATAATAEFLGARNGLGVYLLSAQASFRTDLVFAAAAVMALLSLGLFGIAVLLERVASARRSRRRRTTTETMPAAPAPRTAPYPVEPRLSERLVRPTARIVLTGITRRYPGGVLAVDDLDLTIAPGEFVALVGPSGCGKSTVLRLLAGLDEPDAGQILLDGSSAAGRLGTFSYLPQSDALLPWRTAQENIAVAGRLAGLPAASADAAARRALRTVGLESFASALPEELSGGMRSRVSLLRTALQPAGARLLDEPFAALDAVTRRRVHEWFERACTGTTLLVTHDVTEAVFLADRVVVLSPRPARVQHEIAVPLPRPRTAAARRDPHFFELCSQIEALLDTTSDPVLDPA